MNMPFTPTGPFTDAPPVAREEAVLPSLDAEGTEPPAFASAPPVSGAPPAQETFSKRIDPARFPHSPRPGASNLPATLDNVRFLLAESQIEPRFNVIKKRLELRRPDGTLARMSEVVSLATLNGMGTNWLYQFVEELAEGAPHNPVKDWIRSRPWDGADRLGELCTTVVEREGYPEGLKQTLIHRWLLSATRAVLADGRFQAHGVLTLQGAQGAGKTSWVASLLPAGQMREEWAKLDHHMDGGNKDSIIGAIRHWITEIGELDSSFKKDVARLKGFLTNDCDKLRRPYAREEVDYPRRTVFAATVNEETFLVDSTGNRRFWTIAVDTLNFQHRIDMQQVYAQLAVELESGAQWWLTSDEDRQLAAYNLQHRSVSAIAERIRDHIDVEKADGSTGTAQTAIEVLRAIGITNPSNAQCKEAGGVLRELIGAPKRIQGRDKWRVPVRGEDAPYRRPWSSEADTY